MKVLSLNKTKVYSIDEAANDLRLSYQPLIFIGNVSSLEDHKDNHVNKYLEICEDLNIPVVTGSTLKYSKTLIKKSDLIFYLGNDFSEYKENLGVKNKTIYQITNNANPLEFTILDNVNLVNSHEFGFLKVVSLLV